MLKQGTFINRKFYSMLFFNLLTWGTNAINTMVDAILGGNQLGEVALSAVSIVSPLCSIITVVSLLFSPGCGILYGIFTGKFDKENAYKTAGWCVVSMLILGVLLSAALFMLKTPFLNYFHCTGALLEQASVYYNWYIALALIYPVYYTVYYLSLAEGAAFYIMIGTVSMVGGNIVLSYVLCQTMGVSGLGQRP